jgi:hypothetical protein
MHAHELGEDCIWYSEAISRERQETIRGVKVVEHTGGARRWSDRRS